MSNRSFVGKVEILGRDEILGWERRSRRQRIQNLKVRAAAGDQQAIARLQRLQAELSAPVTASSTPYASPTSYAATTYPQQSYQAPPAYQTPYFDASLSQDPYGPPPQPTVDSFQGDDQLEEIVSSGRDEILGSALSKTVGAVKKIAGLPLDAAAWALRRTPVPSKSWFVGHQEILGSSFVGDDERAYAADGGMADKMALQRRITSSGSNRHLAFVRGDDSELESLMIAQIKKDAKKPKIVTAYLLDLGSDAKKMQILKQRADAGSSSAKNILKLVAKAQSDKAIDNALSSGEDADASDRQKAKQILQKATDSKSIKREDLRQAIALYAGTGSTVKERTAVGSKMIEFCNKKKIKLEG
jgi:hypothetical protein